MAKVAMFMGPMAKKKRVNEKYCPNSYRVISHEAETIPKNPTAEFALPNNVNMLGQSSKSQMLFEHRKNRPNPTSVGFLSQDVRLLNEPICHVQTSGTFAEQHQWWPSRANAPNNHKPSHTLDTTFRKDYQPWAGARKGSARHTANPNKTAALGAVPVNFLREPDNSQRVWREKISYEHKYNCRTDPQYPIRAKRHGAFVWDRYRPAEVKRMADCYGSDASSRGMSPVDQAPKALSAPVDMKKLHEEQSAIKEMQKSEIQPPSQPPVLPPIGY